MNSLPHSYSVFMLLSSHFFIAEVTSLAGSYFFYQQPEYPRDCKEVRQHCSSDNSSGVHKIKPDGYSEPFEVYCDNQISPGGWTVIQRQVDGLLTFKRNWEDYRNGFGFLSSEFYIGNEKLAYLTNQAVYELRVDMVLSNGSSFYLKYNSFRISDEWSSYVLVNAEDFSGNSSCVATSCPIEMVHESCSCQTSCRDPIGMTDCSEVCVESCTPVRCFVTETNSFISDGDSYMAPGCSEMCSCTERQLTCDKNYRCDRNAVCERRNDELQCYCNPGYSGDGVNCTSICQSNEVYGTCTCQKSCRDPTGCASCNQGNTCYCPDGFYLQGGDCVQQEDCGCFIDGQILPNGETYVNSDCSRRCTCNNDQLSCDSIQCSPNAACRVDEGVRQCHCNERYEGDGQRCTRLPARDCNDVRADGNTQSGVYSIRPAGSSGSFDVFCNMTIDGGGWTVFQRRINGATNFYKNWASYKNGFGDIRNEFWLGNEKLYYLTQQANYEVRVDYVTSSYSSKYEKWTRFRIDNEASKYRVTDMGSRSGTSYSLYYINNIAFSTHDQDNDGKSSSDCAEGHRSGWWHGGYYYSYSYRYCYYFPEGSRHRRCSRGNLNGDYNGGNGQNIFAYYYYYYYWYYNCNIKYTEMRIRRIS